MLSEHFYNYLSKIKFSYEDQHGYDSELVRVVIGYMDINEKVNIPHMNIKILLPNDDINIDKYIFLKEAKAYIESFDLDYSHKLFFSILYAFNYFKNKPHIDVLKIKQRFNRFITLTIKKCAIYQSFPMKYRVQDSFLDIKLNSFKIGKFNYSDFKNLLQKETASDFAERLVNEYNLNPENLFDLLSIERYLEKVPVLDFYQLFTNGFIDKEIFYILNDYYFEALSDLLFQNFWDEFIEEQNVTKAYGLTYYDPYLFRDLGLGNGIQISTYYKIDNQKRGWVIPIQFNIQNIKYNSQLPVNELNIKSKLLYDSLEIESEFSPVLIQLINFLAKGNKELQDQKFSEAILNYWVALDTILNNSDEANSNSLKNRVSALICYLKKMNHRSAYFKVSQSYTQRSKYVHAGEILSESDAVILRDITQTILEILIRIHTKSSKNELITYDQWISDIDLLAVLGRNTTEIPTEFLQKIGIID